MWCVYIYTYIYMYIYIEWNIYKFSILNAEYTQQYKKWNSAICNNVNGPRKYYF